MHSSWIQSYLWSSVLLEALYAVDFKALFLLFVQSCLADGLHLVLGVSTQLFSVSLPSKLLPLYVQERQTSYVSTKVVPFAL